MIYRVSAGTDEQAELGERLLAEMGSANAECVVAAVHRRMGPYNSVPLFARVYTARVVDAARTAAHDAVEWAKRNDPDATPEELEDAALAHARGCLGEMTDSIVPYAHDACLVLLVSRNADAIERFFGTLTSEDLWGAVKEAAKAAAMTDLEMMIEGFVAAALYGERR